MSTALITLAEAYCPDVPSYRESRGCAMHGVRLDSGKSLGETFCGRLCNESNLYPLDLVEKRICKRCLRNAGFAATVQAAQGGMT